MRTDIESRFRAAPTFEQYLDTARANQELWRGVHRLARVPEDLAARASAIIRVRNLLVLSEDWCGDAVNLVPLIARTAEQSPSVDLRVLGRDANPDIMDAHLTNGSKSIPIAILYDAAFDEVGWWGPRPRKLQEWVMTDGKALPKDERYREIRRWYARDRGRSTFEDIVALLER
jgi:hypothetical protein